MTATAHALIGGAIAATIHDPAIGIPLALVSHPLLDMVPHWDFGLGWRKKTKTLLLAESLIDLSIGVFASYFIFSPFANNLNYFIACLLASELFDILMMPYLLLKWDIAPFSWAYQFQHKIQGKANLPWGILTQVISVIIVFYFLDSLKYF